MHSAQLAQIANSQLPLHLYAALCPMSSWHESQILPYANAINSISPSQSKHVRGALYHEIMSHDAFYALLIFKSLPSISNLSMITVPTTLVAELLPSCFYETSSSLTSNSFFFRFLFSSSLTSNAFFSTFFVSSSLTSNALFFAFFVSSSLPAQGVVSS